MTLSLLLSPATQVLAITTARSRPTLNQALKRARSHGGPPVKVDVQDVHQAGATEVYAAIRDYVERWNGPRTGIVVDITSGTKAMTAAASLAAGQLNLRQVYIAGDRLGRGPVGREAPCELPHPLVVFGDAKRLEAERAFDAGSLESAERIFDDLEEARARDYHYAARGDLCRAYRNWERLDFDAAADRLDATSRKLRTATTVNIPRELLVTQANRIDIQAKAARRLASATRKDARPAFDATQTADLTRFLTAMARRRRARDPGLAALLFYRVLELAIQRRLATHGLDASAPEWTGMSADLVHAYNAQVGHKSREIAVLPTELDLTRGRTVLLALDDLVMRRVADTLRITAPVKFEGKLAARNKSVFAHGYRTGHAEELAGLEALSLEHARAVLEADGQEWPAPVDAEFDFLTFATHGPPSQ